MSASIGHACFPANGADAETLQRAADLALYRVKHEGRGKVVAYTLALNEAVERRRVLRDALPGAIAHDEFQLAWQQQVSAATGALRGAEALLRWPSSPLGRPASPAEFLPEAADARLEIEIPEDIAARDLDALARLWPFQAG